MAIAIWKSKKFQISNEEIQGIKSMTIADTYNDSFNEDGKRVGFEPVTLSVTLDINSAVLSGDKTAREEMDEWRSLAGQEDYFYLNGLKLISLPFKLLKVNSSNFVLGTNGEMLAVSLQLDFQQAQTAAQAAAAAAAAKSNTAGKSSGGSSSVVGAVKNNSPWGTYDGGKMTWPVPGVKSVSSEYGPRNCPFHGREVHTGIDIPASTGTSVVAAAGGTVVLAGYSGGYGKCVIINHGNNIYTLYGHLSSYIVSNGQKVTAGQKIGGVGSTGNSTGPHLHFEVRKGGNSSSYHTSPWNYVSR